MNFLNYPLPTKKSLVGRGDLTAVPNFCPAVINPSKLFGLVTVCFSKTVYVSQLELTIQKKVPNPAVFVYYGVLHHPYFSIALKFPYVGSGP